MHTSHCHLYCVPKVQNLRSSTTSSKQTSILLFTRVTMSNGVSFQQGMFQFADCNPVHTDAPHFLESCFRCRKRLGRSSDIFMYKGSTPFCSAECREEQILIDESMERHWRKLCTNARSSVRSSETDVAVHKFQVHVA